MGSCEPLWSPNGMWLQSSMSIPAMILLTATGGCRCGAASAPEICTGAPHIQSQGRGSERATPAGNRKAAVGGQRVSAASRAGEGRGN
jgi:hypothetical protein